MTSFDLINATVVTSRGIRQDGHVVVRDGTIADIRAMDRSAIKGDAIDLGGDWLVPGFIDTQVNGGGDVLFNDAPTVETIAIIGEAHARFGTTGFLATLISDDLTVIDAGMRAVEQAIRQGVPGILGIHIEGPFIAEARKGIHDPTKFRRLSASSIDLLSSLAVGRTMVTLAPELCTPDEIAALVAAGVVVSAGHTDADYATTVRALDAGVTGFTHLFNAMSPMAHRAPGVVGAALDDQNAYCGLIVDGHHVAPPVLRVAVRARPIDRFMLVTDAMPSVGGRQTDFTLNGRTITVRDGVCVADNGTLAGCDLDMATAFRNVVRLIGASVEEAATMASLAPARFLSLEDRIGSIAVGNDADLVRMTPDLVAIDTWRRGYRVDVSETRRAA